MTALFDKLVCWLRWLGGMIFYAVVEAADFVIDAIGALASVLIALLPGFAVEQPQLDRGVVGFLNYFIPIRMLLAAFTAVMTAWILYRLVQWALRWAKAAD